MCEEKKDTYDTIKYHSKKIAELSEALADADERVVDAIIQIIDNHGNLNKQIGRFMETFDNRPKLYRFYRKL